MVNKKELNLILFLLFIILVAFGWGSLKKTNLTAIIVLTILASAFFGWLVSMGFKLLMDFFAGIKADKQKQERINGQYTSGDFREIYRALEYLITAAVATFINIVYDEGIRNTAENYSSTDLHYWLGGFAIVGAIILLLYLLGVFQHPRKKKYLVV